jgi:hypothetical protein
LFRDLNEYINLWNLSITCKLFSESKKYLTYKLNRIYSLKYYKDKYFRTKILKKIFNPQKQLYIDLSKYNSITNVSILGNVYSLNLSGCEKIIDVRPLRNVKILNLSGCKKITDVSPLRNVKILDLSSCRKITRVGELKNVRDLNLRCCINIIDDDIIELAKGTINTLNIRWCYKITNFDVLENIPNVKMPSL